MQIRLTKGLSHQNGYSLLELLLVMSIVVLLVMIGAPSIVESIKNQQLKGALQQSYFLLKKARATAVSLNQDITVQFENSSDWCIALSDSGPCDCHVNNACTVDSVEYKLSSHDYPHVQLPNITMGKNNTIEFDNTRGIAVGNAGSSVLSDGKNRAKLIISNLGRVRICMQVGSLGAYRQC